jgi:transposase
MTYLIIILTILTLLLLITIGYHSRKIKDSNRNFIPDFIDKIITKIKRVFNYIKKTFSK